MDHMLPLFKYHWTSAEQRTRDNETIHTTIGNLANALKTDVRRDVVRTRSHANSVRRVQFDFSNHLRQSYLLGNVTLMDADLVSVNEVAYLVNISKILSAAPARLVQNYAIWRFMMNRASNMPRRIRSTREQFDRVFKGTSAEPTRTTACANYVNDNMGFAVSRLYVKTYFDENARNQVRLCC
jgi:endothelin-converting enzyme-like 1